MLLLIQCHRESSEQESENRIWHSSYATTAAAFQVPTVCLRCCQNLNMIILNFQDNFCQIRVGY